MRALASASRRQAPGAGVEAGTEQHHLVDPGRRLRDPVVDQFGAGDAGGSRAGPAAVDVIVQQRCRRAQLEKFCRQSKFSR